jgi:hypothetical protein
VTCHLEYRLKVERRGASRRPKARPCESLRAITPTSVAVRCVASAGAASVEPPVVAAVSAEDVASVVVAEDMASVVVVAEATAAEATAAEATGKKQR